MLRRTNTEKGFQTQITAGELEINTKKTKCKKYKAIYYLYNLANEKSRNSER